jgi:hypothetical protein
MSKNEEAMDDEALARLKRLAGNSTLILTHYGRKSGKPYEVKISGLIPSPLPTYKTLQ